MAFWVAPFRPWKQKIPSLSPSSCSTGGPVMAACSVCGRAFSAPKGGRGRPRKRCDSCRTNLGKIDGIKWRRLREQVLREQPMCAVRGCPMPSTQVDHIIPLKLRPDLGLNRSNLQGMCARHNASKGAKVLGQSLPPSEPRPPALAWFDTDEKTQEPRRWVL